MPVFNGLPFLADAIESILSQTFQDFELVIVDDGSRDGTREILKQYAGRDRRINLVLNDTNVGVAEALNTGIRICRGQYIARMDADDLALPERLQLQVEFMDRSPEIGVCGTWFTTFGHETVTFEHPVGDDEIKVHHLLHNAAICHPTAFVRRSVLLESRIQYRPEEVPAEDLWLWIRLGFVTRFANLPRTLLLYRTHANQTSMQLRSRQHAGAAAARLAYAEKILSRPLTERETLAHGALSEDRNIANPEELEGVCQYAAALEAANAAAGLIDRASFRAAIDKSLRTVPLKYAEARYKYSRKFDLGLLRASLHDPLRPLLRLRLTDTVRFVVKCAIRHIPGIRAG
jgi:glycosyltransferase involved in cell wall biosynthesis